MSANPLVAPHLERFIEPYFDFHPDLIIEATNACNRACNGCYAANILVNAKGSLNTAKFLEPNDLRKALAELGQLNLTTIRGGEPSIHPEIVTLLEISSAYSNTVILETHGRWIKQNPQLLEACKRLGIIIKVSFDSMHGLSVAQLQELHQILSENSVSYLLAITESTFEQFEETRSLCSWIPNNRIIFQKKAVNLSELVKPKVGVIKTDGKLSRTLSVKNKFLSAEAK